LAHSATEDPTDEKTIQEAELIVIYFKNELGMMEDVISKDVHI
jgi:hypothetical protein